MTASKEVVVVFNTFSQEEWERLHALMGLMDDPVFTDYVEWGIGELQEKHGKEIVLLNMKEMYMRMRK